ncbi:putative udp-glucose glucosyltransferase [Quercus suber]|uniref:Udp-glucose glucosyltransferase n=1 Tax=Quercus suber TaxID=58331 RepID=A0AAW0IST6_QUESU
MALNEQKEEIHVLMVSFASQGHINPLLRLGKHLVSKGLHSQKYFSNICSNLPPSPPPIPSPESIEYDRKVDLDLYMETLSKFGPISLSNLIKNHFHGEHKRLSCIIKNPFVPWVLDVAEEQKIPCAMLWIQPCSL